jgi:RNA polymerase sigma-70 factor, ECF subfamily
MTRLELIDRSRKGDREAFAELAASEIERLYAIASLMLRDTYLAQDAVQETLMRCWRQLPSLRDVANFESWLYRILVRAAATEGSRQRRFKANVQALHAEPPVDDVSLAVAERERLERAFDRLSIDHRAVVVLRYYADLALEDVALALDIPLGTAKSRHHYAMAELRSALEAEARLSATAEGRT